MRPASRPAVNAPQMICTTNSARSQRAHFPAALPFELNAARPLRISKTVHSTSAKTVNAAHRWIDFVYRPKNNAVETAYTYYGSPVRQRLLAGVLAKSILSNPAVFPSAATVKKLEPNQITAKGTATVHAAKGTANLTGAVGEGTVIAGATTIVGTSTTEGEFAQGETIYGKGIPAGTTITAVSGSELTISAPATETILNTALEAGTTTLSIRATA